MATAVQMWITYTKRNIMLFICRFSFLLSKHSESENKEELIMVVFAVAATAAFIFTFREFISSCRLFTVLEYGFCCSFGSSCSLSRYKSPVIFYERVS